MPYTYATLSDALTVLAARLYDPLDQFWTQAEKIALIQEALRTFNAYTSFWRSEFVFPLTIDTWWYDLTTAPTTLRPITVTDNDLITQIEYHLLEPLTTVYPLVWSGSNQFSIADILGALARRRDEVLAATGCHLTRSVIPALPGRTYLPDYTIDIRRVAWLPVAGFGYSNSHLHPSDPWAKEAFDPNYTTAAMKPPSNYLQSVEPALSFDIDSTPPVPGSYDLLTVDAGVALTAAAPVALGLPDDWTWVAKFGALADLLGKEALAKDLPRAMYCERRYREGLALLSSAPALLSLRMNNLPLVVSAVHDGDDFNPGWQAAAHDIPKSAYTAGLNLLAFGPKPDSSIAYSITAYVVRNAPIPTLLTDKIQLGHEHYEAVIDYAHHLATLKQGGTEFLSTLPLYQNFIKQATLYNSKLAALGQYQRSIYELAQLQESHAPRYAGPTPEDANG